MGGPLTGQQIDHFHTFGFLVLKGWLTPEEHATLAAEHELGLDEEYRDNPFDGTGRHNVQMLSDATPLHVALTEDERFAGLAAQLYGDDVFFAGADANRYVGASDYHPGETHKTRAGWFVGWGARPGPGGGAGGRGHGRSNE